MKFNKNQLLIIIFLVLNFISPWFWVVIKNPADFMIRTDQLYEINNEERLYQINTLRGQSSQAGLGLIGKLTINKFTWFFKEIFTRTVESFDPYFLFFKGDLNIKRSTWVFGPVYWFLLPMVVGGFLLLSSRQKIIFSGLTLFCTISGAFIEPHYFAPSKIPLFIIYNILASNGLWLFLKGKLSKNIKVTYLILFIFEISRFMHDFYFHYPNRILSQ
jgi:hypothetical protein